MKSLTNEILEQLGDSGIEKISQSLGKDSATTKNLLSTITPFIVSGLSKNSEDAAERDSLFETINRHSGGVFDKVQDESAHSEIMGDGEKIFSHIFKDNSANAISELTKKSDVDESTVKKVASLLGPMVLGKLADKKVSGEIDLGNISDFLGQKDALNSKEGIMGMATKLLDKDKDGNLINEAISFITNRFKK